MAAQERRPVRRTGLLVLLVAAPGEGPLELEARRKVYLAIGRFPGLDLTGLAKQAGLDVDLVRYHVRVLEKAGLAHSVEDGAARRIFPRERTVAGSIDRLEEHDRNALGLLRKPPVLRIVIALLDEERRTSGALAKACGISPSTLTHHVKNLQDADLVVVAQEGRYRTVSLSDPSRVRRLLSEHPPPRDLVQGFIEAWDDLGF